MNGIKYLLDTNASISFFQGNSKLRYLTSTLLIGISIISIVEFLSFAGITDPDKQLLFDFATKIKVVDLKKDDLELINVISELRTSFKIKLTDAIISGKAIYHNAVLITNDKDFSKISHLKTSSF